MYSFCFLGFWALTSKIFWGRRWLLVVRRLENGQTLRYWASAHIVNINILHFQINWRLLCIHERWGIVPERANKNLCSACKFGPGKLGSVVQWRAGCWMLNEGRNIFLGCIYWPLFKGSNGYQDVRASFCHDTSGIQHEKGLGSSCYGTNAVYWKRCDGKGGMQGVLLR